MSTITILAKVVYRWREIAYFFARRYVLQSTSARLHAREAEAAKNGGKQKDVKSDEEADAARKRKTGRPT